LDGLSTSFLFLSCLLIFLCVLFIWDELAFREYAINLLLIGLFLALIFTVEDLLLFYVFFEAILIPMYLVIGIWGSRERKIRAVYLFFFYTLWGSLLTLVGILYIYSQTGSLNFEYLSSYPFTLTEQLFLWAAFFLSFASKIPMFPVHIWLPEAHVEAPTVGSVLLAGILLKLGVYGFIRYNLTLFFDASVYFSPLVYLLCIVGVIYASLSALRQTDLKRIIAYSSIAHMNLVVLGIFSFNVSGLEGSIIQSISHGFVSGGMFLLIGILYNRYHTRFLHYYGGIVHFMPIFSGLFLIFTMANIALPGTSSFIGEFLLLLGIFKENTLTAVLSALGVILSGAYSLWLYNRVVFGNIKVNYTQLFTDINFREFVIMFSLLIFLLVLGISPNIFLRRIHACSTLVAI
ncbi:MAG TPA: NADH-quinone oxidoreductase subunit M, partial [Chitinophagales bacterium]|nr:NADH-quinone oxidoreductase subunit M [Chitinophagales bacterium]